MKGLVAVILGTLAIGCGGSGGGAPGASGVASGKRLDTLTDAEKAQLCDWTNAKLGGYGGSIDCGGGLTLDAKPSQAACVAGLPTTCAATVAQAEACANAQSCANLVPAECAPLLQCS
jgi:hypothetical protein